MALWRRYESRLRDVGLYPSTGAEHVYKNLLNTGQSLMDGRHAEMHTNGRLNDEGSDGDQDALPMEHVIRPAYSDVKGHQVVSQLRRVDT
jgi:hypothetical protein